MPQLIDFYEEFENRRKEFEIIAFHRENKRNFEELDPDLASCKDRYWKGRDLPFPILLDDTGDTIRGLGVSSYPTILLVGPDGKLRKHGSEHMLRKELMTTDKGVKKHLKKLKGASSSSKFASVAKDIADKDDDAAAWALMLFAGDEKRAKEKHLLALLPLFAGMTSESAHSFLFGTQGLAAEKATVRLAAIDALKAVEKPPEMLPYILSQAFQKEEDEQVKKVLEDWLQELGKQAEDREK